MDHITVSVFSKKQLRQMPPGFGWQILLWLVLTVTLFEVLWGYGGIIAGVLAEINVGSTRLPPPAPDMIIGRVTLPLALLIAGLRLLTTWPVSLTRRQWLVAIGVMLLLAGGLFLFTGNPFLILQLLGADIPEAASQLVATVWPALALLVILMLLGSRRVWWVWRSLILGGVGGIVLTIGLVYPVYTPIYTAFANPTAANHLPIVLTLVGAFMIAVLGLIIIGLRASSLSRPQLIKPWLPGALAGGAAALFLFAGLGAPVAGLMAQANYFLIAPERPDLNPEYLWFAVLNATFPMTYGLYWLLLGCGVLAGGLAAWGASTHAPQTRRNLSDPTRPILWPLALLAANLGLMLMMVINVGLSFLYGGLSRVLEDVFDRYGYLPHWSPEWTAMASVMVPWLALVVIHGLILHWLYHLPPSVASRRALLRLTVLAGLLSLFGWPFLFYVLAVNWLDLIPSLAFILLVIILGLELITFVWRQKQLTETTTSQGKMASLAWVTAGAVGSLIAAIMIYLSVATLLNLYFIINVGGERIFNDMPWPGPARLDQIVAQIMALQFAAFFMIGAGAIAVGAFFGWGVRLAGWLWATYLKPAVLILRPGCLISLLMVAAVGAGATWVLPDAPNMFIFFVYALLTILLLVIPARPVGWLIITVIGAVATSIALAYYAQAWRFITPSLMFICGLILVQRRFFEHWAWPSLNWTLLSVIGWMLLVLAGAGAIGDQQYFYQYFYIVLGVFAGLGLSQPLILKNFGRLVIILAFSVTIGGLLGLILTVSTPDLLGPSIWWPTIILLLSCAFTIIYHLLVLYTPTVWRFVVLIFIPLWLWLSIYVGQNDPFPVGGVSRYNQDSRQWEQFTAANSALVGNLNYQFFNDSQNRLWLGTGTGLVIKYDDQKWRTYDLGKDNKLWEGWNRSRVELMGDSLLIREDQWGNLWLAGQAIFGRFNPERTEDNFRGKIGDIGIGSRLPVVAMNFDTAGNLWLVTANTGVVRLDSDSLVKHLGAFVLAQSNGLLQNDGRVILIDRANDAWYGSVTGLNYLGNLDREDKVLSGAITSLLEDSRGQLWVGTEQGGYVGNGESWAAFEQTSWPAGLGVTLLFEDSLGNIWAGTVSGAFHFDGEQWIESVSNIHVTTFAEGPPSIIWIGTQQGLVRFDLATDTQTNFNTTDSTLVSDWVRDVLVDQDGEIWVSTFSTTPANRSLGWFLIGMLILFFGYLLVIVYRGYKQSQT